MKKNDTRRFDQIKNQANNGVYGIKAQKMQKEFDNLSEDGIGTFFKTINGFFEKEIDPLFRPYSISLIRIIVSLFLKNNKDNSELADYFTLTYNQDIQDMPNSCIKDKFANMLEAGHAFKQSINSNKTIIWELSKNYFLSYNEFMNQLIGIILINLKYSIQKKYKINTLKNAYGSKINELTDFEPKNEDYNIILELLNSDIRNAIAHQTIWFDEENNSVIYKTKSGEEKSLTFQDFILMNSKASYLAEAYLVALSTIGILYFGTMTDRLKFPKEIVEIMLGIKS